MFLVGFIEDQTDPENQFYHYYDFNSVDVPGSDNFSLSLSPNGNVAGMNTGTLEPGDYLKLSKLSEYVFLVSSERAASHANK